MGGSSFFGVEDRRLEMGGSSFFEDVEFLEDNNIFRRRGDSSKIGGSFEEGESSSSDMGREGLLKKQGGFNDLRSRTSK